MILCWNLNYIKSLRRSALLKISKRVEQPRSKGLIFWCCILFLISCILFYRSYLSNHWRYWDMWWLFRTTRFPCCLCYTHFLYFMCIFYCFRSINFLSYLFLFLQHQCDYSDSSAVFISYVSIFFVVSFTDLRCLLFSCFLLIHPNWL